MRGRENACVSFPYSYDQVVDAIASTRGDGAHFTLTMYLHGHEAEVGADRFRRLLATAKLRGQDQMNVHASIANLDPSYARELPGVLRSASSVEVQQVLLAMLPDLLPRGRDDTVADELEAWLRRRVERRSYLENSAIWEIPSVVLAVLYSTDTSRARALLAELEPHLGDRETPLAHEARDSDDESFEAILEEWRHMDSSHLGRSATETAERDADWDADIEREAVRYMRRLGFGPSS
jgi:hypothetical protein